MAKRNCIGCNKPIGGLTGAFGVRLVHGEVCLTCKNKLVAVPNYQLMTPNQVKSVIEKNITYEEAAKNVQKAYPDTSVKDRSAADEIREFKKLLDEGLITSEEYEQAKNKIINNR